MKYNVQINVINVIADVTLGVLTTKQIYSSRFINMNPRMYWCSNYKQTIIKKNLLPSARYNKTERMIAPRISTLNCLEFGTVCDFITPFTFKFSICIFWVC